MPDSTVPFGKYKGRPVEDMLRDSDYVQWLSAQPWFRERFSHLLRREERDELGDTPEHNRLQALFLNDNYRLAFLVLTNKGWMAKATEAQSESVREAIDSCLRERNHLQEEVIEPYEKATQHGEWIEQRYKKALLSVDKIDSVIELLMVDTPCLFSTTVKFEDKGADVLIKANGSWVTAAVHPQCTVYRRGVDCDLPIEVKPVVSDDYPIVLRQMNRNGSKYLFLGAYQGTGATFSQFVGIFAASGKIIVMKETVDKMVADNPL